MALAIFPGRFANPSCIAARELSKILHEEAPILAPFSTTVDFNVLGHFYFESYRCFPFSVQDVSFLSPASVPLSGILTCYRANYCWKCSLYIKIGSRWLHAADCACYYVFNWTSWNNDTRNYSHLKISAGTLCDERNKYILAQSL